jgi:phage-related protein
MANEEAKERVNLEKETKDLGNEIIAQYNALPPVLKKIIDESKVINDIAQQNVDAARDLTEEEQAAFDVKQDHSKILAEVLANSKLIGTENFKNYDLSAKIRKEVQQGNDSEAEKLIATQNIAKAQAKIHKQVTEAAKAAAKPIRAVGDAIQKLPGGAVISKILGFDDLADKVEGKFIQAFMKSFGMGADEAKKMGGAIKGFIGTATRMVAIAWTALLIPIGIAFKMFQDLEKATVALSKKTGLVIQPWSKIGQTIQSVGISLRGIGASQEDVSNTAAAVVEHFGTTAGLTEENLENITHMGRGIGLGGAEAAGMLKTFQDITGRTDDTAQNMFMLAKLNAEAADVAPQAVLKDIAESSEAAAKFTKGTGQNLIKASIFAKKIGMDFGKLASSAESLLDFESSVNAEMEASMLLGRQINLGKARELAMTGDMEGLGKELLRQVGSEAEWNRMNYFQRQALAKAVGMSVKDVGTLIGKQKELTKEQKAQLTTQEMLAKGMSLTEMMDAKGMMTTLEKIKGAFGALLATTLAPIITVLGKVIGKIGEFADKISVALRENKKLKDILQKVGKFLGGAFLVFTGLLVAKLTIMAAVALPAVIAAATGLLLAFWPIIAVVVGIIAVIKLFTKLLEKSGKTWGDVWVKTKELASKGWDKVKKLAGGVVGWVKDKWSKIAPKLKEFWSKTKEFASKGWDKATEIAGGISEKIKKKWEGSKMEAFWTGLKDKISKTMAGTEGGITMPDFGAIWVKIKTDAENLRTWFVDTFGGTFTRVWEDIKGAFQPLRDAFGGLFDEFGFGTKEGKGFSEAIGDGLEFIWKLIKPLMPVFTLLAKVIIRGIGQAFKLVIDAITIAVNLITKFIQAIKGVWNAITGEGTWSDAFAGIGDLLYDVLMAIPRLLGSALEGIWNIFAEALAPAWEWIKQRWNDTIEGVKLLWTGFVDSIKEKVGEIKEFATGIKEFWVEKITALGEGIKQIFQDIKNFIGDIFKGLINLIIMGINQMIRGLNTIQIDIPDWWPGDSGGQQWGFGIKEIELMELSSDAPSLQTEPGGGFDIAEGGLAKVHTGESVGTFDLAPLEAELKITNENLLQVIAALSVDGAIAKANRLTSDELYQLGK